MGCQGDKFILTNANIPHAKDVLAKLRLQNIFKDIIASDIAGDEYKPNPSIYHIANHEFKITDSDIVYFFEDSLDNIKAGKNQIKILFLQVLVHALRLLPFFLLA